MDIPDAMVDNQVQQMMQEFAQSIAQQGLSLDQYMQFTGMTKDRFIEQMKPEALKRVQTSLVLEKIAAVEKFEVTKEDIEKKLEEMAKMYGMKLEEIKDIIPETEKENIKKDVAIGKAVDFIMENAKEKAAKKSTAKKSTAKKTVAESIHVQFDGRSYESTEVIKMCKDAFKANNKRKPIDEIAVYVNANERTAYYVVKSGNEEIKSNVSLYN